MLFKRVNFFLLLFALLNTQLVYAQIEKGQGLLSGSFRLQLNQGRGIDYTIPQGGTAYVTDENRSSTLAPYLQVERGKFYKDGWLAGYGITIDESQQRQTRYLNTEKLYGSYRVSNLTISGFIRHYWKVAMFNVYIGGGLVTNYNLNSNLYTDYLGTHTMSRDNQFSISPSFQAGAFYPFTNRLALELKTQYNEFSIPLNSFSVGLVRLTGKSVESGQTDVYKTQATNAGNWAVSGGVAYSNITSKKTGYTGNNSFVRDTAITRSNVAFTPSIGLFIHKNLVVGVGLSYYLYRTKGSSPTGNLSIRPYVREYIGNSQLRPYAQVSLYLAPITWPRDTTNNDFKQHNVDVSLGLAYIFGDHFLIDANLIAVQASYYSDKYGATGNYRGWSIIGFGSMSPAITLNYIVGNKKKLKTIDD